MHTIQYNLLFNTIFSSIQYYDMLGLFAVTTQTQLSARTVPPRSDGMSRAAPSDRNNLAPRPMTALQFQFQYCNTTRRSKHNAYELITMKACY